MTFIQLVEYTTSKPEEVADVVAEWQRATEGKRTARRVLSTRDRDNPERYCDIVFFDSHESAMENSRLPETQEYSRRMGELVDGEPTFRNLDLLEDREL
jgi:quinol monooxygenase YgiN